MKNFNLKRLAIVLISTSALAGRLEDTPDFTQKNPALPDGGSAYCAPVAVSNSLVWLAKNGFPKLVASDNQVDLVAQLGSKNFIDTQDDGTNPSQLIEGVKRYVTSRGYSPKAIQYWGWRPIAGDVSNKGENLLSADLLKEWAGTTVGWVNVGWYRQTSTGYERFDGHWVTLVEVDQNRIAVVDPAIRAGGTRQVHWLTLEPIRSGTLTGKNKNLPRAANGLWRITSGLVMKPKAEAAIIDATVLMKL